LPAVVRGRSEGRSAAAGFEAARPRDGGATGGSARCAANERGLPAGRTTRRGAGQRSSRTASSASGHSDRVGRRGEDGFAPATAFVLGSFFARVFFADDGLASGGAGRAAGAACLVVLDTLAAACLAGLSAAWALAALDRLVAGAFAVSVEGVFESFFAAFRADFGAAASLLAALAGGFFFAAASSPAGREAGTESAVWSEGSGRFRAMLQPPR